MLIASKDWDPTVTAVRMEELPHVEVRVDQSSPDHGVRQLVATLKWDLKFVELKRMTMGMVNCLVRCSYRPPGGAVAGEDIMVRVFGNNGELDSCFNRDSEVQLMRVLAREKLIPPLYFSFSNGIGYGYAEGDIMKREQFLDDTILRKLAQYLHRVHHTNYEGYVGKLDRPGVLVFMDRPWEILTSRDVSSIEQEERFKASCPSVQELHKEVGPLHSIYDKLCEDYQVVYCHADVHIYNMIHNPGSGNITFIDWEGSNWCPEIFEAAMLIDRDPTGGDIFKSHECRRKWLRTYLSTHPKYGTEDISEELVNRWFLDSLKASTVSTFIIVSYCLASSMVSPLDGDFILAAIDHYKLYKKLQKEVQELVDGGRSDTSMCALGDHLN